LGSEAVRSPPVSIEPPQATQSVPRGCLRLPPAFAQACGLVSNRED